MDREKQLYNYYVDGDARSSSTAPSAPPQRSTSRPQAHMIYQIDEHESFSDEELDSLLGEIDISQFSAAQPSQAPEKPSAPPTSPILPVHQPQQPQQPPARQPNPPHAAHAPPSRVQPRPTPWPVANGASGANRGVGSASPSVNSHNAASQANSRSPSLAYLGSRAASPNPSPNPSPSPSPSPSLHPNPSPSPNPYAASRARPHPPVRAASPASAPASVSGGGSALPCPPPSSGGGGGTGSGGSGGAPLLSTPLHVQHHQLAELRTMIQRLQSEKERMRAEHEARLQQLKTQLDEEREQVTGLQNTVYFVNDEVTMKTRSIQELERALEGQRGQMVFKDQEISQHKAALESVRTKLEKTVQEKERLMREKAHLRIELDHAHTDSVPSHADSQQHSEHQQSQQLQQSKMQSAVLSPLSNFRSEFDQGAFSPRTPASFRAARAPASRSPVHNTGPFSQRQKPRAAIGRNDPLARQLFQDTPNKAGGDGNANEGSPPRRGMVSVGVECNLVPLNAEPQQGALGKAPEELRGEGRVQGDGEGEGEGPAQDHEAHPHEDQPAEEEMVQLVDDEEDGQERVDMEDDENGGEEQEEEDDDGWFDSAQFGDMFGDREVCVAKSLVNGSVLWDVMQIANLRQGEKELRGSGKRTHEEMRAPDAGPAGSEPVSDMDVEETSKRCKEVCNAMARVLDGRGSHEELIAAICAAVGFSNLCMSSPCLIAILQLLDTTFVASAQVASAHHKGGSPGVEGAKAGAAAGSPLHASSSSGGGGGGAKHDPQGSPLQSRLAAVAVRSGLCKVLEQVINFKHSPRLAALRLCETMLSCLPCALWDGLLFLLDPNTIAQSLSAAMPLPVVTAYLSCLTQLLAWETGFELFQPRCTLDVVELLSLLVYKGEKLVTDTLVVELRIAVVGLVGTLLNCHGARAAKLLCPGKHTQFVMRLVLMLNLEFESLDVEENKEMRVVLMNLTMHVLLQFFALLECSPSYALCTAQPLLVHVALSIPHQQHRHPELVGMVGPSQRLEQLLCGSSASSFVPLTQIA